MLLKTTNILFIHMMLKYVVGRRGKVKLSDDSRRERDRLTKTRLLSFSMVLNGDNIWLH